jgi:hypothetical protein
MKNGSGQSSGGMLEGRSRIAGCRPGGRTHIQDDNPPPDRKVPHFRHGSEIPTILDRQG